MRNKTQEERLDYLVHEFKKDSGHYWDLEEGEGYEDKRMAQRETRFHFTTICERERHAALDQAECQAGVDRLAERFDRTKAWLDEGGSAITEKQAKKERIERFLAELERFVIPVFPKLQTVRLRH